MTTFAPRGRRTQASPAHRFEELTVEPDEEERAGLRPRTVASRDATRSMLPANESPDAGLRGGPRPDGGRGHGCVYGGASPPPRVPGFSAGLAFEPRFLVTGDAPPLRERAFRRPAYRPQPVAARFESTRCRGGRAARVPARSGAAVRVPGGPLRRLGESS